MRTLAVAAALVVLAAGVAVGNAVKTTVKDPTSLQSNVTGSVIGGSLRLQGPGSFASVTSGALSFFPGSLNHAGEGATTVKYQATSGTNYRLLTTAIAGFSYSYAKSFGQSSASMISSNTLDYSVTRSEDGDVQVVMAGSSNATALALGPNQSQSKFKPLFKFYATLVAFDTEASLKTWVKSSSSITAGPISTGVANGQIYGFVYGLP
jgi:hypothetical protein